MHYRGFYSFRRMMVVEGIKFLFVLSVRLQAVSRCSLMRCCERKWLCRTNPGRCPDVIRNCQPQPYTPSTTNLISNFYLFYGVLASGRQRMIDPRCVQIDRIVVAGFGRLTSATGVTSETRHHYAGLRSKNKSQPGLNVGRQLLVTILSYHSCLHTAHYTTLTSSYLRRCLCHKRWVHGFTGSPGVHDQPAVTATNQALNG